MSEEWITAGSGGDMWDGQGEVQGTYNRKREGIGPNNSNSYHLTQEDGTEVGVWGSTVIDNKFGEIPTGAIVKIKFTGMQTGKRGNKYKDYDIQYKYPKALQELIKPNKSPSQDAPEDLPPTSAYEDLGL